VRRLALLVAILVGATAAAAEPVRLPILVPVTGFLSLEGTSQRNGALLALKQAPAGLAVSGDVIDTATAPENAVNALMRALDGGPVPAVVAPMLGTQMLALMPVAVEEKLPLLTVSGTASLTQAGNPWVFRFFPSDRVAKEAHVRYVVEELGKRKLALVYQTTAYGQSGATYIAASAKRHGAELVFSEGIDTDVKDMAPVLRRAVASGADALLLHLHAGPTALAVRQIAALGLALPVVAGSALHQPATAALLDPKELKGICAESAASPVSGGSPRLDKFLADYRAAFGTDPDAYALAQYDGTEMLLDILAHGARTGEAVRTALAAGQWDGIAMHYASDGHGDMAHSTVILCYDGTSRVPRIVKRYDGLDAAD
jgi:branched-chain amino acid transport system substrate-binding protein